jgi:hypothetical protein
MRQHSVRSYGSRACPIIPPMSTTAMTSLPSWLPRNVSSRSVHPRTSRPNLEGKRHKRASGFGWFGPTANSEAPLSVEATASCARCGAAQIGEREDDVERTDERRQHAARSALCPPGPRRSYDRLERTAAMLWIRTRESRVPPAGAESE